MQSDILNPPSLIGRIIDNFSVYINQDLNGNGLNEALLGISVVEWWAHSRI
jgi:hypothetical protein